MQFSLFLGLSNLELLQDEDRMTTASPNKKRTTEKLNESMDRRSSINKDILEPPKLKVSAPRHICSLFQDINELFEKILEPYPKASQSNLNPISILNNSQNDISQNGSQVENPFASI